MARISFNSADTDPFGKLCELSELRYEIDYSYPLLFESSFEFVCSIRAATDEQKRIAHRRVRKCTNIGDLYRNLEGIHRRIK